VIDPESLNHFVAKMWWTSLVAVSTVQPSPPRVNCTLGAKVATVDSVTEIRMTS
jgi:hypothetical protein